MSKGFWQYRFSGFIPRSEPSAKQAQTASFCRPDGMPKSHFSPEHAKISALTWSQPWAKLQGACYLVSASTASNGWTLPNTICSSFMLRLRKLMSAEILPTFHRKRGARRNTPCYLNEPKNKTRTQLCARFLLWSAHLRCSQLCQIFFNLRRRFAGFSDKLLQRT